MISSAPFVRPGTFSQKIESPTKYQKMGHIAIGNCGSYARCMASNYNAREFAPEYFIEDLFRDLVH